MLIRSLNEVSEAAKFFIAAKNEFQNTEMGEILNCIAIYGKMGVGKTTLIKTICEQLEVVEVVNSPSFAIINEYHTKNEEKIFHFDFYRINKIEEVYDLGYEDYFYSGNYCFIEWPEKISGLLPQQHIEIYLAENSDGSRKMKIWKNSAQVTANNVFDH